MSKRASPNAIRPRAMAKYGQAGAKPIYAKGPIPYEVSAPNRFWRIKKDLPPQEYWKKRYWRRRITGKGAYSMNAGDSFGRRWGGYLGSKAGEFIGGYAQRLTGLGDYKVTRNVFADGRLPEVVNNPQGGGTVIRFQEYLGDIITSATANTFDIQSYDINAANPRTFPWLSQIAANYDQYDFEGLLFEFKSTSADALNSTNTALGSVMMATQYDTIDPPFDSKLDMLNYEYSTSIKPSMSTMHMVECDPKQTTINELYTLSNQSVPPNADPRLYFLGRFQIATTGFQGLSVNVGQLHVTYQVRLLKPKLFTTLGNGIDDATYRFGVGTTYVGYDNTHPLTLVGEVPNSAVDNIPLVITPTTITFPVFEGKLAYRIEIIWRGATAVNTEHPDLSIANGTLISVDSFNMDLNAQSRCGYLLGIVSDGSANPLVLTVADNGILPSGNNEVVIRVMQTNPIFKAV